VARRPLSVRILLGVVILLVTVIVSAITSRLILGESLADGALDYVLFALLVWPVLWWFDRRRRKER
jgi:uncharacterized membrane protein YagU involved in acid resistance